MNRQLFKSWAENQLHEVDGKIVMIMDNGPYHWVVDNKLPTSNASKMKIARVGNKSEYYRANQEKWCRFRYFPARARGSEPRVDFSVSRDDFSVSHKTNSLPVWCA
jgi:hypothetical protein